MKRNAIPAGLLAAILALEPVSVAMAAETIPNQIIPETTVSVIEETILEQVPGNETEQTRETTEERTEPVLPEDVPPVIHTMPEGILFADPAPLMPPVTGKAGISLFRRISEDTGGNLVLKKTVRDNQDGSFTLRLESYATGTASVVTQVPVPSDVVLVLDESGSMDDCIACGHEMSEDCSSLSGGCLHKVYRSQLDKTRTYRTYYRNSAAEERTVGFCSGCNRWFSNGPYKSCSGHGSLGYWVAFETENDTHNYDNKVYHTQFYAACDHNTQRMDALKGAVTEFMNRMYANSLGGDAVAGTPDDIDNRIAIVGYDNDTPARIYTPENGSGNGYITANSVGDTVGALKNMVENRDAVFAGLDRVRVRAATATHRGMEAASMILSGNPVPAGEKRNRVVILFTDGSPGSGYVNDKGWANSAINYAHTIKKDHGATVYTVGLFWGADASDPANLPNYDVTANGVNNPQFFRNGNRFLHLVSSNYPDAGSLDSPGNVAAADSGGYYLSTDDESGLYSIFGKLSGVVTPGSTTVTLDERSVVKDLVTEVFRIDGKNTVSAWTESYRGEDSWEKDSDSVSTPNGGPLSVSVEENTVTVTGFDFAEHYVAADENLEDSREYRGKKLVFQIVIRPIAGFLGGDDIDTNLQNSGIYAGIGDMEPVKRFEIPSVDVTVRQILPDTRQKDIYLSQTAQLPELLNPGSYHLDGGRHWADRVKNKYADIIYTLADPDNHTWRCTIPAGEIPENAVWEVPEGLDQNPLLKEDTPFSIRCDVISVNDRQNRAEAASSAQIHVYLPEITFRDSGIDLGQIPDYEDNFCSVRWFHGDKTADPEVLGRAPELQFAYSPEASAFRKDTAVAVSVTAKREEAVRVPVDQNITSSVAFYREGCSMADCDNSETTVVDGTNADRINFVVHLNTFHLRIEKQGADLTLDSGSNFLFRVTGPKGLAMDVVVPGNGSVWIRNLPVGTYYVTELTDWSWRYEPENVTIPVDKFSVTDGVAEVLFVNTRTEEKWLDGETRAENRFHTASGSGEGGTV